jgi:hypothetical protein
MEDKSPNGGAIVTATSKLRCAKITFCRAEVSGETAA